VYAVNNGYLDKVKVEDIGSWEKGMHEYLSLSHAEVLTMIDKGWDDSTEESLKKALDSFVSTQA
jgi:F-type H+-transporting ATPase subunit alpha